MTVRVSLRREAKPAVRKSKEATSGEFVMIAVDTQAGPLPSQQLNGTLIDFDI